MNPKSELQELCQKRGFKTPEYSPASPPSGPAHSPSFAEKVIVEWDGEILEEVGEGRSKKAAQKMAAQQMHQRIKELLSLHQDDMYEEPVASPSRSICQLLEMLQRDGLAHPEYKLVSETGPAHKKQFTFKCCVHLSQDCLLEQEGSGSSKKFAEAEAAKNMIAFLQGGTVLKVKAPISRGAEHCFGGKVGYEHLLGEEGVYLCLATASEHSIVAHGMSRESAKNAETIALGNLTQCFEMI